MSDSTASTDNISRPAVSFLPHVARGATINLAGAGVRTVLLYAYTLMLARLLSVNELGEYFLMFTIINILGLVSTVGMDTGLVRFVALYAGEGKYGLVRRTMKVGIFFGLPVALVTTVALIIAAPLLSDAFFDSSVEAVTGLRVFALAVPFWVAARLFNAATQGLHKMQYQVYSRDFGEQLSKLALSAAAIIFGFGLMGVIWANVSALVIATLLSFIFIEMILPGRGGSEPLVKPLARDMIRYSLPLAFSNILGMVLLWIDMLLLGYLGTTTEVGFYGAALRVGIVTATIITAFGTVFSPVIADLFNRNEGRQLRELLKTVSRWIFICCYPLFLTLFLFAEPIMRIFGVEYAATGNVLILLAIGQIVNATLGSAGFVVVMSGKSYLELLNVSVALIVNVTLCLLLIPEYGAVGAATANMASLVTVNVMRVSELWIIMRVHAYDRSFVKPFLAGVAGAALTALAGSFIITGKSLVQEALLVAVLLSTYLLAMLAMGLNEQDKKIVQLIMNRLRRGIVTA